MPPLPVPRNAEAIRLYRDILRLSRHFTWRNERGELWRNLVASNARKEFEEAREERDPLIVARLLFVGRDCLNQLREKFVSKTSSLHDHIDKTRNI
jgi:hypothetical protein